MQISTLLLKNISFICRVLVTFGLNALDGRHQIKKGVWGGDWNSSNTRDFINYTISKGYQIDSWEFGIFLWHFLSFFFVSTQSISCLTWCTCVLCYLLLLQNNGINVAGNELSGKGIGAMVYAEQYGSDLIELRGIIDDLYRRFRPKPLLVAPGGFYDKQWFAKLLQTSGSEIVDVMTHHMYNLGPGLCSLSY